MDHAPARASRPARFMLVTSLLVCSLLLTACDASSNSSQTPTRPAATPAPIDTSVADTAGCPATGQSGKTLYAYSQRSVKDIYVDYKHPNTSDTPHPQYITAIDAQGKKVWERQVATTAVHTWGFAANNGIIFSQLNDRLSSYDGKSGALRWTLQTINARYIALCNDLIYLEGSNAIEARSVRDGSLVWVQAGNLFSDFLSSSQPYQIVSHKAYVFAKMDLLEGDDRCPNKICASDTVYAVDAKTGKPLWNHAYLLEGKGKHEYFPVNVAASDQAVYVITTDRDDEYADRIDKFSLGNGQLLWSTPLHTSAPNVLDDDYLRIDNGRIFVRDAETLFALDALNGKQVWTWQGSTLDKLPFRSNVYGEVFSDHSVDFCARNGGSGKQIWCLQSTRSFDPSPHPPFTGNETTLYALTSHEGEIAALRADSGRPLWKYNVLLSYDRASFKDATDIRALEVG